MTKSPRIITFDIETSPLITTSWGIYTQFLSVDNIVKDWFIISAAWKVLGEDKVQAIAIKKPYDDYSVVKKIRDVLATADVIIGQNCDKFDIKKLNARMIYHGIEPLPQIPTIDTKKEAKKIAAFTSNKLEYLGNHLLGEGKIKVDYQLWLDVLKGSKKAIKEMVEYNKVDVIRNEEVYLKLKPYMKTHPHIGVMSGQDRLESCPKCGSTKVKRNGVRPTASGIKRQECQCGNCGGYFRIPFKII